MTSPLRTGRRTGAALIACLALAGCGGATEVPSRPATVAPTMPSPATAPTPEATPSESALVVASPSGTPAPPPATMAGIDGVVRPTTLALRTPLAVLIDDSIAARPH